MLLHETGDALGRHAVIPSPFRVNNHDRAVDADAQAIHLAAKHQRPRADKVQFLEARFQEFPRSQRLFARGALRVIETGEFGPVVTPAPAPRLSGSAPGNADRTPDVDEDGAEVRNRLLDRI